MAEFALGLTKTAVAGTVSRVKLAVQEEKKLRESVEEDLVFITGEFEMMQAFLSASSAGERTSKNKVVRAWVRQLRDLAFDVENCVEFVVHLDKPSRWDWMRRLASSTPCLSNLSLPLDLAAAEIKRLKARVEDVSQRNTRYNLTGGGGSDDNDNDYDYNYDDNDSDSHQEQNQVRMRPAVSTTSAAAATFHDLRVIWKDMGKLRRNTGDLKRLIDCQGSELKVITLWRSLNADVGRLSILKKAYLDQEICQQFKSRAWVKLTNTFNPVEFLNNLLTNFTSQHHHRHDDMSKLMLQVSQHKYLIILEQELSSFAEWEAIRVCLDDGKNGSRVVISTKHLGDALVCTGEPFHLWELQHYSRDQYLCAFFPKGCGHRIGTGELSWQLGRHHDVISLLWQTAEEKSQIFRVHGEGYFKLRVFHGVQFKHVFYYVFSIRKEEKSNYYESSSSEEEEEEEEEEDDEEEEEEEKSGGLWLAELARFILLKSHSESVSGEMLNGMSDKDLFQKCREFLTKHDCLIYIENLQFSNDWKLIKENIFRENTGSCIVVITGSKNLANQCVDYQQHRLLNVGDLIKGCAHRIGMGELSWQLGQHHDVISLLWQTAEEKSQFCPEHGEGYFGLAVFHGVQFEHVFYYVWRIGEKEKSNYYESSSSEEEEEGHYSAMFWLAKLARFILLKSNSESVSIEMLYGMSDEDLFQKCREFLTEHDCLIYIENLQFSNDWKLIKENIFRENTGSCIVVITGSKILANQCVDYQQHRLLNVGDLIKDSHQKDKSTDGDGGSDVNEEEKYECDFIGRRHEMRFFSDDDLDGCTASVWGIAGVGKSALVRKIYNRQQQKKKDYGMYGWVEVAHPFSLLSLCRSLLLNFHSRDVDAREKEAIGMMEGQDPSEGCCKILSENKCLLVIDGLRSTRDYDSVCLLAQANSRGTTIVITREQSIARHCATSEGRMLNVKVLEADKARDMFKKRTRETFSPVEEEILKKAMPKCGGYPGVIVALCEWAAESTSDPSVFEMINSDFMGIMKGFPRLRGLFDQMQSYFVVWSNELKTCIFYLSVFPADKSIRLRHLIQRWIAEGYSLGGGAITEEKAEKILCDLMRLDILYQEDHGTSKRVGRRYKVNGFFHEYIKSQQMEDNLVFELEGRCSPSSRLTGQHLTIRSSWDRDVNVFSSIDLSRLRSLTVVGKWKPFLISDKMKVLRVLDLEDTSSEPEVEVTDDDLEDTSCKPESQYCTGEKLKKKQHTGVVTDDDLELIGKKFPRLKFLSVRGCTHITCLPDSLGAMNQLETLDARHTSIVELPAAVITKLHKLKYIRVGASPQPQPPTPEEEDEEKEGASASASGVDDGASPRTLPQAPTATTQGVHSGVSPFLPDTAAVAGELPEASPSTCSWKKSMARDLRKPGSSWCLFKNQHRRLRVEANGGGVEVSSAAAKEIGMLSNLHTLGVVNIAGGKGGVILLKELKKLTQLRKLGLSGINSKNWDRMCSAISGKLPHLESLSLQLVLLDEDDSYDFASFHEMSMPPRTLKKLKVLYTTTARRASVGGACRGLVWLKQLPCLRTFDHELHVSSQEDIDVISSCQLMNIRLRIKPINVENLTWLGRIETRNLELKALRIDCSNVSSTVTFGVMSKVQVQIISIHCCIHCGGPSCLRIDGLQNILGLKRVLVHGFCSDGFQLDLENQLARHSSIRKPLLHWTI